EHELAAGGVTQGIGEEAAEALHAAGTPRLVGVHDHLGVAVAAELVAEHLELAPERDVVEDLAVVDELDGAVLVGDRLGAGRRQVDDLEPPPDQPDRTVPVDGALVGPAVLDHLPHGLEEVAGRRPVGAKLEDAGDPAHGLEVPVLAVPRAGAAEALVEVHLRLEAEPGARLVDAEGPCLPEPLGPAPEERRPEPPPPPHPPPHTPPPP